MTNYQKYKSAIDKANAKYKKENVKRVVLQLNKNTDSDIIEYLARYENVTGEIKRLIRCAISDK